MPHLHLSHTANLAVDADAALAALNRVLLESGLFQAADIKSRAQVFEHYLVGADDRHTAYAHLTLWLLSGRSEAVRALLAQQLLAASANIGAQDRERLLGYLENKGKNILPEPEVLLTKASKMPGLDGQKMSKSYGNTITLREAPESVSKKIRGMPTDPARIRRTDPGDPSKCPVWQLHQVYTDAVTHEWVQQGCRSAGIGCLECKQPVIDGVLKEQQPMFERAQRYLDQPQLVRDIVAEGCKRASDEAEKTMAEVRAAMGLAY